MFSDLEAFALAQREVFVGTPGTLLERRNAGQFPFYAHQYYDALGNKRERYVAGAVGSPEADETAARLRTRIDDLKTILPSIRLLAREGFQLVESRTYSAVAAMHNHGIFGAGAFLVGSHAYGVLLNRLGIRAASYFTEDIDIARPGRLTFATPQPSMLEILRDSNIEFVETPELDVRAPSTSFKQRGRSTFHVDLLAPARGDEIGTTTVAELKARAVTLPFLGYLLEESQMTAILAREGCCAVRIPAPERFAVHKLIVSTMRPGRDAKSIKDRTQAAVLCAALAELHPGALQSAIRELSRKGLKAFRNGAAAIRTDLERVHPRAFEEIESVPGVR
jgi:hypothetical protein